MRERVTEQQLKRGLAIFYENRGLKQILLFHRSIFPVQHGLLGIPLYWREIGGWLFMCRKIKDKEAFSGGWDQNNYFPPNFTQPLHSVLTLDSTAVLSANVRASYHGSPDF